MTLVTAIDHVVLTVRAPEAAADFHARALALRRIDFGTGRIALKINLQSLGQETRNHAGIGAGDICPLTDRPLADVAARLKAQGVEILEGPVARSGARGPIASLYFADPDGNLVEVATYG
ncbi:VOC family protein [Palleronia rufa]|uniref:VOC family protein n=1 Tax=Palleronia rufa TaxID=1530186 RepID=UPI00055F1A3F|nr:VOC family protein [Palleronia rufa]